MTGPVMTADATEPEAPAAVSTDAGPDAHILVVDDDERIYLHVCTVLQ